MNLEYLDRVMVQIPEMLQILEGETPFQIFNPIKETSNQRA